MSTHQPPPNGGFGPPPSGPPQQGPYGPPQQPHPSYGQQAGGPTWPGGGPQPSGGGSGRVVGLVAASAVLLGLIAWGVWAAVGPSGGDAPAPDGSKPKASPSHGPVYTLTLPRSLVSGEYSLVQDHSDSLDRNRPKDNAYARQMKVTGGGYASSAERKTLIYQGASSGKPYPGYKNYNLLAGTHDSPGIEVAVQRRTFQPDGEEVVCEVQRQSGEDGSSKTLPICSWADPYTQGLVMDSSPETLSTAPDEIDLDDLAHTTATIREEARQEKE